MVGPLRIGFDVKVRRAGRKVVCLAVLRRDLDFGLQGHQRLFEVSTDSHTAVVERPVRVLELENYTDRNRTSV